MSATTPARPPAPAGGAGPEEVVLDGDVGLDAFLAVVRGRARVRFSPAYEQRVRASRALADRFTAEDRVVYGVTTGFGDNYDRAIAPEDTAQLQLNIVRSHAVSVGPPLPEELVRATWLMQLVGLGRGLSGTSLEVLALVRDLLNAGVVALAPGDGSVGYLSVEAHLALVLVGEGSARVGDQVLPGAAALAAVGLSPVRLRSKEGLSLTNGTHTVTGIAAVALHDAQRAARALDVAAALSLEALRGTTRALDPRLHAARRHPEQASTARDLLRLVEGSEIAAASVDGRLQDPYSLRAVPQMHGGAKRALADARRVLDEELASVGDNPVLVATGPGADGEPDGVALMGANFDSTYLGLAADAAVTAMTVLAKVSERRTDRMVNSHFSGLPAFLVPRPGLDSGYMIVQYTAAALVMELRALSAPASADTVPTSANQEDPVSNAYLAARQAHAAAGKLELVAAIELLCAAQALDLLAPLRPGPATAAVHALVRSVVAPAERDRHFGPDIEAVRALVASGAVVAAAEAVTGPLEG